MKFFLNLLQFPDLWSLPYLERTYRTPMNNFKKEKYSIGELWFIINFRCAQMWHQIYDKRWSVARITVTKDNSWMCFECFGLSANRVSLDHHLLKLMYTFLLTLLVKFHWNPFGCIRFDAVLTFIDTKHGKCDTYIYKYHLNIFDGNDIRAVRHGGTNKPQNVWGISKYNIKLTFTKLAARWNSSVPDTLRR